MPHRITRAVILAALLFTAPLAGCASIAGGLSSIAGSIAGPTPKQATTLAEAQQSATLAADAMKAYVDSQKLSVAQLQQISALNDGLHSAVGQLEQANANGQSLSFAAFNAALAAWNSYTATVPKPNP